MSGKACEECGATATPGQAFCDDCGAFLDWGTAAAATPDAPTPPAAAKPAAEPAKPAAAPAPAATPAPAAPAAPAAPPAPKAAPAAEAPSAVVLPAMELPDDLFAPDAPAGDRPHAQAAESEAATRELPPHDPAAPAPAPPAQTTEMERARALLVPVADRSRPTETPPPVAPVLPGTPEAARPTVRTAEPDAGPLNGIGCPWCGTANQTDRHFCRRCAMRLADKPEGPARRPWWRRITDWRNREAPWAGERPRLRRDIGQLLRMAIFGVIGLALVVGLLMAWNPAAEAIEDHFAGRAAVHPTGYEASHSYPDHGPEKAFDEVSNSWWGPGYGGAADGQWIQADFGQPTDLLDLVITPGESARPDQTTLSALPEQMDAIVTTPDGKTTTQTLTLDDGGVQHFTFRHRSVSNVRFVLKAAYGATPDKQVAIAEIEFFGRKGAS